MNERILELSVAAAIVIALPAFATAQSVAYGTSPVSLTACNVNESYNPGLPFGGAPAQRSSSGITLGYVNTSDVAAKTVKVTLSDGMVTRNLIAAGNFSPGVQVERNFGAGKSSALGTAACKVAEVDFADGSTWHAAPRNVATR